METILTYSKLTGKLRQGLKCPNAFAYGLDASGTLVFVNCGSPKCPVCGPHYAEVKTDAILKRYEWVKQSHPDYGVYFVTLTFNPTYDEYLPQYVDEIMIQNNKSIADIRESRINLKADDNGEVILYDEDGNEFDGVKFDDDGYVRDECKYHDYVLSSKKVFTGKNKANWEELYTRYYKLYCKGTFKPTYGMEQVEDYDLHEPMTLYEAYQNDLDFMVYKNEHTKKKQWVSRRVEWFIKRLRINTFKRQGCVYRSSQVFDVFGNRVQLSDSDVIYSKVQGYGEQGKRIHLHILVVCEREALIQTTREWKQKYGFADRREVKARGKDSGGIKGCVKYMCAYQAGGSDDEVFDRQSTDIHTGKVWQQEKELDRFEKQSSYGTCAFKVMNLVKLFVMHGATEWQDFSPELKNLIQVEINNRRVQAKDYKVAYKQLRKLRKASYKRYRNEYIRSTDFKNITGIRSVRQWIESCDVRGETARGWNTVNNR